MLDQYGCNKAQNEMAVEFNKQLKDAVMKLRGQLPDAAITYVDLYAAKYGLISDAKGQGEYIRVLTLTQSSRQSCECPFGPELITDPYQCGCFGPHNPMAVFVTSTKDKAENFRNYINMIET